VKERIQRLFKHPSAAAAAASQQDTGLSEANWRKVCAEPKFPGSVTIDNAPESSLVVSRTVTWDKNDPDFRNVPDLKENIWPIWVSPKESDTTISDFQKHWDDASTQARTTAKWIATILGAALAALIGTAPLSGIRNQHIPVIAYVLASIGLVLVGVTLFLVIRVLVPRVTAFTDVLPDSPKSTGNVFSRIWKKIRGKDPFSELSDEIEKDSGLLLPSGIDTLAQLGGRARIEELTLCELAKKIGELGNATATKKITMPRFEDSALSKARSKVLTEAQTGRAEWLDYLSQTITQWTVIASYVDVKRRTTQASRWGLIFGILATALIIAAFLMPTPPTPSATLISYRITPDGATTQAAQAAIGGAKCATFKGIVVGSGSDDTVTVLVQGSATCNAASITIPAKDLIEIA
jgi:hypothetical protein